MERYQVFYNRSTGRFSVMDYAYMEEVVDFDIEAEAVEEARILNEEHERDEYGDE